MAHFASWHNLTPPTPGFHPPCPSVRCTGVVPPHFRSLTFHRHSHPESAGRLFSIPLGYEDPLGYADICPLLTRASWTEMLQRLTILLVYLPSDPRKMAVLFHR